MPVAGDKFSIELKLAPGSNAIRVRPDAAGNVGRTTATVFFNAGISYGLHAAVTETKPVAGAKLVLTQVDTGAKLAEGKADETGAFSLNLSAVPVEAILTVTASGFRPYREQLSIPDDSSLTVNVSLSPRETARTASSPPCTSSAERRQRGGDPTRPW